MNISVIQIFEQNFESNIETISKNAAFANVHNLSYIVLDNTDENILLGKIRNLQKKYKIEYVKKDFKNRTENILEILDLVLTENILFIYEFDLLTENLQKNILEENFPNNGNETRNVVSKIQIFQRLNLNINPKNKTNKFYNNNFVFIFPKNILEEFLYKIKNTKNYIQNWNIEIFYFYILENLKHEKYENYIINSLDFESFNNKEIFLAKKYRKEYLKLKYKYSKNILEKIKIKLALV
jgi:hypothetical protein